VGMLWRGYEKCGPPRHPEMVCPVGDKPVASPAVSFRCIGIWKQQQIEKRIRNICCGEVTNGTTSLLQCVRTEQPVTNECFER